MRTVVLPAVAVETLTDHLARFTPAGRDALVFGTSPGRPRTGGSRTTMFARARKAIGRDDLTWHDLRHSAMTLVAVTGATLPELMQRAGHSTPRAAPHYQHAPDSAQQRIAERLERVLGPTVAAQTAPRWAMLQVKPVAEQLGRAGRGMAAPSAPILSIQSSLPTARCPGHEVRALTDVEKPWIEARGPELRGGSAVTRTQTGSSFRREVAVRLDAVAGAVSGPVVGAQQAGGVPDGGPDVEACAGLGRTSGLPSKDVAPGDFVGNLPVSSFIHPAGLLINTSEIKVLRRQVGLALRTSGLLASMGRVGSAWG